VAPSETAAVTVDHLGHAYLNREPVAMADLDQRMRRLLEGNPALAIVINADGDASHRDVVAVLDALRLAGASRMAIAVTPTSQTR